MPQASLAAAVGPAGTANRVRPGLAQTFVSQVCRRLKRDTQDRPYHIQRGQVRRIMKGCPCLGMFW